MTAKKKWINKICSQENSQSTQIEIVWSGSESEDDIDNSRKKVPKFTRSKSMWIQPAIKTDLQLYHSISESSCSQESPIISNFKFEDTSPILVNTHDSEETLNTSPVIGKSNAPKRVRSRCGKMPSIKKKVFDTGDTSPDLFLSQATQVIQCDSPDSDEASFCHIVSFPSQESSKVANYGSDSSFRTYSSSSLYHEPARKKKKFKKGGLAYRVQKMLELQKTRNSIWQHEAFVKKNQSDLFDEDIVYFSVSKSWVEYGSMLMECLRCECDNDVRSNNENGRFLAILGTNVSMNLDVGKKYELHPPYCIDKMKYGQYKVPCYINVTRFKLHKC